MASDYRKAVEDAYKAAADAPDTIGRAALLYDAARRIPRFPSLAYLQLGLLRGVVTTDLIETAPGLAADAGVLMTRLAILVGADELTLETVSTLKAIADQAGDDRTASRHALALAMVAASRGQADIAMRQLEVVSGRPRDEASPFADATEAAMLLAARKLDEAEARLRRALDDLPAAREWDGERHDAWGKIGFVHMHLDRIDLAIEAIDRGRALADRHGCLVEAGQCVMAMVPMQLVAGQAGGALAAIDGVLPAASMTDDVPELEMPLRALRMRALEAMGDLAGAIGEGYTVIRRCATRGSLSDYAAAIAHMAAMYRRGGAPLDAVHILAQAEKALSGREEAEDALVSVREAQSALAADLGLEEYQRLLDEARRLDPQL